MIPTVWPVFEIATATSPGCTIAAAMNCGVRICVRETRNPKERKLLLGIKREDTRRTEAEEFDAPRPLAPDEPFLPK